jgi:polyhydroxyalkanoate synthesis regulator phasin
MPDTEARDLRQQVDEMVVNVRNEFIVQAATLVIAGQQAFRAGLGLAALSADETRALLQQATERGEIAEDDMRKSVADLRQQAHEQAQALDKTRVEMPEKATIALNDSLATIMKQFKWPGK